MRVQAGADLARICRVAHRQPVLEGTHFIALRWSGDILSTFAEMSEGFYVVTGRVDDVDFCSRILLVADRNRRAVDVFKARFLDPQFIGKTSVDVDGLGKIAERIVNQGQSCLVFLDCGDALAFEGGIEQRVLPAGRRHDGHDAVLATIEMQVFAFVADVFERGETGMDIKVYMRKVAVLRDVETNGYRTWISRTKIEIDIAHCRIERSWICIRNDVVGRNSSRRWRLIRPDGQFKVSMRAVGPASCKHEHIAEIALIAGTVVW